MSTLTRITQKELERQRRPISLEEKQEKFIAAVRKRGNTSDDQGENERQRKQEVNRNT